MSLLYGSRQFAANVFTLLTGLEAPSRRGQPDVVTGGQTELFTGLRETGLTAGIGALGKAILIGLLGSVAIGSVGAVGVANQLSHTRITYTENPEPAFAKVEKFLKSKSGKTLAGIGVLGALVVANLIGSGGLSQVQERMQEGDFTLPMIFGGREPFTTVVPGTDGGYTGRPPGPFVPPIFEGGVYGNGNGAGSNGDGVGVEP